MSESSEQIEKLASALAKAQGKITGALKDTKNDFFKSKYADLAACWDACRGPLSDNGLAVIQTTELSESGVVVVTTLVHDSGQWVRGKLRMQPKDSGPQAMGSCITYARRYALAAIVGLAQIDDDANAASGHSAANDPRGDVKFDEKDRDKFVSRFRDALDADVFEDEKAELVFAIHQEISPQYDLYIATADALGTASKRAIKTYVAKATEKRKGMNASGRAAA